MVVADWNTVLPAELISCTDRRSLKSVTVREGVTTVANVMRNVSDSHVMGRRVGVHFDQNLDDPAGWAVRPEPVPEPR
jgi:hypothetical protein